MRNPSHKLSSFPEVSQVSGRFQSLCLCITPCDTSCLSFSCDLGKLVKVSLSFSILGSVEGHTLNTVAVSPFQSITALCVSMVAPYRGLRQWSRRKALQDLQTFHLNLTLFKIFSAEPKREMVNQDIRACSNLSPVVRERNHSHFAFQISMQLWLVQITDLLCLGLGPGSQIWDTLYVVLLLLLCFVCSFVFNLVEFFPLTESQVVTLAAELTFSSVSLWSVILWREL